MHSRASLQGTRPLLSLLAAALLSPVALAQSSFELSSGDTGYFLPDPPGSLDPYERMIDGDLLNDGLPGIYYLQNGVVRGRFTIGSYDSPATVNPGLPVEDFDIGFDVDRDRIFAVDASGLLSAEWDGDARHWAIEREASPPRWDGALHVRAIDRSVGQRPYIYGVMADGREVRVLIPTTGGFADRRVFMHSETILGFEDVQFDGAGLPELALVTASGGGVYSGAFISNSGAPLVSAPTPLSSEWTSLVVGHLDGDDSGRVAWLHGPASAPTSNLTVLDPSGAVVSLALPAATPGGTPLQAGAVIAEDFDGDQDLDLLLSNKAESSMIVLVNGGTAAGAPILSWTPSGVREIAVPNPDGAFGDDAMFAADIDSDGDADYGAGLGAQDKFLVIKSATIKHRDMTPGVIEYEPGPHGGLDRNEFVMTGLYEVRFGHAAAPAIPAGATHLEVIFWEKPDPSTPLLPDRLTSLYLPLNTVDIAVDLAPFVPNPPHTGPPTFESMFFGLLRYVTRDSGNTTNLAVFPAKIYGFEGATVDEAHPSANKIWLNSTWPGSDATALELLLGAAVGLQEWPGPGHGGGTGSCGSSGGECLPCFDNNPPKP
ncbi:MAG: hypothetical protein AAF726_20665 [Planctomycetota bacterium]